MHRHPRLASWGLATLLALAGWSCDRERPAVDRTPPATVRDLAAAALSDSSYLLTWTAPGVNGGQGAAASYDIRGSREASADSWWDSSSVAFDYPGVPRAAPDAESLRVVVPRPRSVWFFALKAADEAGNWSETSNLAIGAPDTLAPGPIRDLIARSIGSTSVQLTWTATGDDDLVGTARAYDLRWSPAALGEENWSSAVPVTGLPAPSLPGSTEVFTVEGLAPGTVHCFAIRSLDEVGHVSDISASCTITTRAAESRVIAVAADGSGEYPTIQAAIDSASAGDVIELADGTYRGDGNRDIDFRGKAVTVRSRSGNPEACRLVCDGSPWEPHLGFRFTHGEGPLSVVEGVFITGAVNNPPRTSVSGSAFYCTDASPTIRNCFVRNNRIECDFHPCGYSDGGFAGHNTSARLEDCTFLENSGGVSIGGSGSPTVVRCTFIADNLNCWSTQTIVADCTFSGGSPAISCGGDGTQLVIRCVFTRCGGDRGTGGVYCENGSVALNGCRFEENYGSGSGYDGEYNWYGRGSGAVFCRNSEVMIVDCVFTANRGFGEWDPPCGAGAVLGEHSRITLRGCTLDHNEAHDWYPGAGALLVAVEGSTLTLERTILSGTAPGPAVRCDSTSAASASCCDAFGNAGGNWVEGLAGQGGQNGNISADPLFCDPANRVFTLSARSPCLPGGTGCGLIGALGTGCQ
jgi:hypothetical protein